jgi:hypothetical protein
MAAELGACGNGYSGLVHSVMVSNCATLVIHRTHMVANGNGIGFSAPDGWRPVQVKFQAGRTSATEASRRGSPAMSMAVTRPWRMVSSITARSRAAGAMMMRERRRQSQFVCLRAGREGRGLFGDLPGAVRDLEMLGGR